MYLRIMPLGDSITAGTEFIDNVGTCKNGGYRTFLYRTLKREGIAGIEFVGSCEDGPPDIDRRHEGHPGWRLEQLGAHAAEWFGRYMPGIVLCMGGSNDIIQGCSAAECLQRLKNCISILLDTCPDARPVLSTIAPLRWSQSRKHLQPVVEDYNRRVLSFAQSDDMRERGAHVVDVHSTMREQDLVGTHPSPSGYARIAETWYPAVKSIICRAECA